MQLQISLSDTKKGNLGEALTGISSKTDVEFRDAAFPSTKRKKWVTPIVRW